jgi:tetratricopeptide (TPR) repeat protein
MTDRQGVNRLRRTKDIIPVPTWAADELMPPEGIDPVLASELWQRARDVKLWSDVPTTRRERLFVVSAASLSHGIAEGPEPINSGLQTLRKLVGSPQSAGGDELGQACSSISAWAEQAGHVRLSRTYAEAWAVVEPLSAKAAATAGGLCTRLADYSRAEIWLQRAVRIGRATKDWEWYIRGYLRLGILRFNLGNYKPARRYYARAYRTAVWGGFDTLAGKARHDLMTICTDVSAFDLGIDYAAEVLRLYPVDDPVFPYFVHDFAFLLLQAGGFQFADDLLSAAVQFIPDHRRLLIYGTMARTAAALGDRERYESLSLEVQRRAAISEEGAAAAYVRLADGARQYGEWERAERLAGTALVIAHKRHEGQPQRLAHRVLDRVSIRDSAAPAAPLHRNVAALMPQFLGRLQKHSAPAESAGALTKTP